MFFCTYLFIQSASQFCEILFIAMVTTQILSSSNEDYYSDSKASQEEETHSQETVVQDIPLVKGKEKPSEQVEIPPIQVSSIYRTLSGGIQSPRANISPKAVLERINSKKATRSYQLGHQLSRKWSTGAGPRIGCVADYPPEVRFQALEFVKLSPRLPPTPSPRKLNLPTPHSCLSPKDNAML